MPSDDEVYEGTLTSGLGEINKASRQRRMTVVGGGSGLTPRRGSLLHPSSAIHKMMTQKGRFDFTSPKNDGGRSSLKDDVSNAAGLE